MILEIEKENEELASNHAMVSAEEAVADRIGDGNHQPKEAFLLENHQKVVNTNKFKVIIMSTKKMDANDAATLAYYQMKDMLPEAHLCDQTSEGRMLKTRSILVQSPVKINN